MPQKHLLFERVKCGFANHAENESIDQYIVRLRQLVESRDLRISVRAYFAKDWSLVLGTLTRVTAYFKRNAPCQG